MGGSASWFSDGSTHGSSSISSFVSSTIALWIERYPVRVRAALDSVIVGSVLLAFAQAADADVLFHIAWTVLALQAFTTASLPATLARIAFASVCLLAYWVAPSFFPQMSPLEVAEWPLMLLISVIVAIMAEGRRQTSRRFAELYRRTSDRLLTTQEAERKRLATDLHDGVGQALSSLAFTLEAAEESLPAGHPVLGSIELSRELVANAADETRVVAGRLQPPRLEQRGLLGALRELCARAGLPVSIELVAECETILASLASDTQMQLFRIAQEAISNAVRHSDAQSLVLSFQLVADSLELVVSDNGRGIDTSVARDEGLGLAGMQDRASVIGGVLRITSVLGLGTEVRVSMPKPKIADGGLAIPQGVVA